MLVHVLIPKVTSARAFLSVCAIDISLSVLYLDYVSDDYISKWGSGELPSLSYLKDWHMVRDFPSYHAYDVPLIFMDDWMNWWWDLKV